MLVKKRKRAGVLTSLIILILCVYGLASTVGTVSDIVRAREQEQMLEQELLSAESRNAELRYSIENADNPALIEKIARRELGLVYPDEILFYDLSD